MAEIKASGQITIVDLSDSRQLTMYLTSTLPKTQIYDTDTNSYIPDWSDTNANLIITPNVFLDQKPVELKDVQVAFYRRDGAGERKNVVDFPITGETVVDKTLKITTNRLSASTSGLWTYICEVTYTDDVTNVEKTIEAEVTFSLVKNPSSVKLITISGEQVFKYEASDDGQYVVEPDSITLTAHRQNIAGIKWQYKNGNTYTDIADATKETLLVKPSDNAFLDTNVATFRAIGTAAGEDSIYDVFSIHKLYDGLKGEPGNPGAGAIAAILDNEAIMIPAITNNSGVHVVAADTQFVIKLTTYEGTAAKTHTGTTVLFDTDGWEEATIAHDTNSNVSTITLTANAGAALTAKNLNGQSEAQDKGTITITCTIGEQIVAKQISWAKVVKGTDGTNGKNAIIFSIYAPNGEVVQNQSGSLLLKTQAYDGATVITSGAKYNWFVFENGGFTKLTEETDDELTVDGANIVNIATYKCQMEYGGKTYEDVITLTDKTDTILAIISSTGGNIFKNGQGNSILVCKLMANGKEVDALITDTIVTKLDDAPKTTNAQCYLVNTTNGTVGLKKWNGTQWVDDSTKQTYTYTWTAIDSDGTTNTNSQFSATGKVIYVDGSDVNTKTTFICDVSK